MNSWRHSILRLCVKTLHPNDRGRTINHLRKRRTIIEIVCFSLTFNLFWGVMKTTTLEVSDPVAEKIARMSPKEKNAIAETLNRLISNRRSLEEIMEEASE